MPFASLTIRFQSAGMIPPPFTHYYTLEVKPTPKNALHVDFSITYTDREELDEEDITGEGFTLADNFDWSGTLGPDWLPVLDNVVANTRLKPLRESELSEKDDYLEVLITPGSGPTGQSTQTGTPTNPDAFLYPIQELIQAIYEAGGKEKPFELSYLSYQQSGDRELHIQASFANRSVQVITVNNRQEQRKTMPWEALQPLMSTVFAYDYNPEDGLAKPPKRDGHFLTVGTDMWFDISALPEVYRALERV
ncbi:hypothetical protein J2I47_05570 [Fibrella sp. HMF5335]|uniref:Uncharacterized protein n=1 Tax=Fibrella rubiginis TaxID=2817060 RepID=A0A939K273_9BACT|nr:hypothetical protein [Fibrella rubiginis]MBO0936009.1 hypothetical protein [Fibrella rubiginis]